jgi:hypothetical protein
MFKKIKERLFKWLHPKTKAKIVSINDDSDVDYGGIFKMKF